LAPQQIDRMAGTEPPGILIGFWDEDEVAEASLEGKRRTRGGSGT
jgi:hypothetical protein